MYTKHNADDRNNNNSPKKTEFVHQIEFIDAVDHKFWWSRFSNFKLQKWNAKINGFRLRAWVFPILSQKSDEIKFLPISFCANFLHWILLFFHLLSLHNKMLHSIEEWCQAISSIIYSLCERFVQSWFLIEKNCGAVEN